jgi:hypothetical protein
MNIIDLKPIQNKLRMVEASIELSRTTLTGIIFRKTIRASYASLDLLEGDNHSVALIQFHDLKEDITASRSFIRRECKIGSEIQLDGSWMKDRFQVILRVGDGDLEFEGFRIIQRQKMDMIQCQRAREKYYPTFDKTNKEKVKVDVHEEKVNSMSKQKKKKTEGIGHGGGLGKTRQGEIVRDFVMSLLSKKFNDDKTRNDQNSNMAPGNFMDRFPEDVKRRFVHVQGKKDTNEANIKPVIDFLNSGSGLMDVAGGSGHVSLAFAISGIKSTVIDPRETVGKLPGRDRKMLRRAIKATRSGAREQTNKIKILPPPVEFSSLRAWFAKRPDGIDVEFREGLSNIDEGVEKEPIPICSMCSEDNLLSRCSAIVALHPDEATGDIVDFAVANRLPFVIVPCCVFSRLFPTRFISKKDVNDGNKKRLVSTYDDLIEYLVKKDDSIKISKLDFEGSNIALWSTFSKELQRMNDP